MIDKTHFAEDGYPKPKEKKPRIPFKYFFMPTRWFAYITGRILDKYLSFEYCEQVVYRSLRCSDCMERGHCDGCGCVTPDLFMNVSEKTECSKKKWPGYMSADDWNDYKKLMDIQLQIK